MCDARSALQDLGLDMGDVSSAFPQEALATETWPFMALNEGSKYEQDPQLFGFFEGGEETGGENGGESLWSKFQNWWQRLTRGSSGSSSQERRVQEYQYPGYRSERRVQEYPSEQQPVQTGCRNRNSTNCSTMK